jgi:glycosyltransferase involved in cell wall biosynthesis
VIVVDSPDDSTVPYVEKYGRTQQIRLLVNDVEPGPAQAIRYGIERATADVVVVTMADGSDDPQQIDQLVRLVERGVVVAAASRYSRGGQQVGGPFLKSLMSRMAGLSLWALARVGTRDATNSFKAYDVDFIRRWGSPPAGLRDRDRAGGQGQTGPPAGGRAADHLAGAPPGCVKLQARELVAPLPALVAIRVRASSFHRRTPSVRHR